jgi:ABC-type amino acid transport substrate-binding protein
MEGGMMISSRDDRAYLAASILGALGFLVAGGVASSAFATDALDKTKQTGALHICAVDGLLPYSSSDPSVPGFEVEIGRAIAEKLGVKADHSWVTWDALIPALTSERCDAIIDGMFITDDRLKVIDFSKPYYGSGETILVRKDNTKVKGLNDLKGLKTGVLAGSVTVHYLEQKGIAPLEVYPDQNTILIELNNRRIDATFMEAPSAAWTLQKDPTMNIKMVTEYVPEERYNAGVGVRKGETRLKDAINTAIDKLESDKAIATILSHYQVPFYPPK